PHPVAVVDPGGHFDRELAGAADAPLTQAGVAGIAHDAARAAATRPGLLQLEEALGNPHLPRAPAGAAGGRLAARGPTAPLAHLALRESRDLDLGVVAEHRLEIGRAHV